MPPRDIVITLSAVPRSFAGLAEALASAGLGVVELVRDGLTLRLRRAARWTDADERSARAALAAWTPPAKRRPRPLQAIADDLIALTAAQRWVLVARLVARLARADQRLLADIGSDIAADEPDPTP